MYRAAVVIGVDRCGGMPVLRGAVAGATRVADWASRQGFEVELLTDSGRNLLRSANIFEAVDERVQRHTLKTLLI